MDQQDHDVDMDVDGSGNQPTTNTNGVGHFGTTNSSSNGHVMGAESKPEYPTLPRADIEDWQYVMRRTMQQIVPGLFLGPYAVATKSKLQDLKSAGITHIVCVREYRERNLIRPNHQESFEYLIIEVEDSCTANIIPHFRTVNPFIKNALASGGQVLVHGSAGISRSVTLVIAYIMEIFGVTTQEAYRYVQAIRFCGNPNEGFMAQLREYEPIYRAMHSVPVPLPSLPSPSNLHGMKRSREMEDSDDEEELGSDKKRAGEGGSVFNK